MSLLRRPDTPGMLYTSKSEQAAPPWVGLSRRYGTLCHMSHKPASPSHCQVSCRLGTLCIQDTANQHVYGQSEQCPSRPHDSDARSWYRRISHTTPLGPHILHSEPPPDVQHPHCALGRAAAVFSWIRRNRWQLRRGNGKAVDIQVSGKGWRLRAWCSGSSAVRSLSRWPCPHHRVLGLPVPTHLLTMQHTSDAPSRTLLVLLGGQV